MGPEHVVYVEVHLELLTIHAFHSYLSSSNQGLVVRGHRRQTILSHNCAANIQRPHI